MCMCVCECLMYVCFCVCTHVRVHVRVYRTVSVPELQCPNIYPTSPLASILPHPHFRLHRDCSLCRAARWWQRLDGGSFLELSEMSSAVHLLFRITSNKVTTSFLAISISCQLFTWTGGREGFHSEFTNAAKPPSEMSCKD